VVMLSKTWVCSPSIGGIAGSNPAEDMDVRVVCCIGRGPRDEPIVPSVLPAVCV
jgi:hypothetical protein